MATPTPQDTCAKRLQQLLTMPTGQRWARQFLDGTEPSYPHQRGVLTLRVDAADLGKELPTIPVSHPGLKRVLGGGFRQGRLVAAGGPPGAGKTTVALQLADEARYLQGVLPLVAEVKVGRTWAETH